MRNRSSVYEVDECRHPDRPAIRPEHESLRKRPLVRSVEAKTVEHRGLLVRKLDSDVVELIGSEGGFRRRS